MTLESISHLWFLELLLSSKAYYTSSVCLPLLYSGYCTIYRDEVMTNFVVSVLTHNLSAYASLLLFWLKPTISTDFTAYIPRMTLDYGKTSIKNILAQVLNTKAHKSPTLQFYC